MSLKFRCRDLDVDMSHACMHIFRRFHNNAKNVYWLHLVCPSVSTWKKITLCDTSLPETKKETPCFMITTGNSSYMLHASLHIGKYYTLQSESCDL